MSSMPVIRSFWRPSSPATRLDALGLLISRQEMNGTGNLHPALGFPFGLAALQQRGWPLLRWSV